MAAKRRRKTDALRTSADARALTTPTLSFVHNKEVYPQPIEILAQQEPTELTLAIVKNFCGRCILAFHRPTHKQLLVYVTSGYTWTPVLSAWSPFSSSIAVVSWKPYDGQVCSRSVSARESVHSEHLNESQNVASSLKVLDGKKKEKEEEGHGRLELDIKDPWVPTASAKQPAQTLNSKGGTNDAPPVGLLGGGQRQRAWTGPSLPPYDSSPSLARPSPTTTHNLEGHSPLQSPPSLAKNVQNDALADSLQELQSSFPVGCFDPGHDDCGSGTGFLVTGKGLTGTGKILGHKPIIEVATPTTLFTSPSSASGQEFQTGTSEIQPNMPTLLLPPDYQSNSRPRRLSPAHTSLHLRRASSPSLAALAKGYLDVHTDYLTQSFRSRRASVDSSYGRSSDSLSAVADVVESRNTMDSGPWNAQRRRPDGTSNTYSVAPTVVGNWASRFASSPMTSGGKDKLGWHTRSPSMSLKADIVVFDLLDVSPKETARQLTLMDSEVFRSINRDELASIAWTGAYKYDRTPSIVAATQHFNKVFSLCKSSCVF
ncbi:hypothetical protein BC832DRAFT_99953 [Gaertneriomyces semiglobifer]|nr:hypothetical protein BC832DRAFT_99953 [Gaertneriomyces semiglobifer]